MSNIMQNQRQSQMQMQNQRRGQNQTQDQGFGGDNESINVRLDNTFNQWTRDHNDSCAYVNQVRMMRKPIKYYTNKVWAPSPTNNQEFITFTPVGNQKAYDVSGSLNFPINGELTSMRNRKYIQYVLPLLTSPQLGANNINRTAVDVNSNYLNFGIGEMTNPNILTKDILSSADYNRWDFVDPKVVQNPENIIFANGIIPRGGISTRDELRNYMETNSC